MLGRILFLSAIFLSPFGAKALANQGYRDKLKEADELREVYSLAHEIFGYPMELAMGITDRESLEAARIELEDFKATLKALAEKFEDFSEVEADKRKAELNKVKPDASFLKERGQLHRAHMDAMDPDIRDEWMNLMRDYSEVFRSNDTVFRNFMR